MSVSNKINSLCIRRRFMDKMNSMEVDAQYNEHTGHLIIDISSNFDLSDDDVLVDVEQQIVGLLESDGGITDLLETDNYNRFKDRLSRDITLLADIMTSDTYHAIYVEERA